MNAIDVQQTIGEIVTDNLGLSRVFEKFGIDYCCGGKKTVEDACRDKGLDPRAVLAGLREGDRADAEYAPLPDVAAMSLTELADHIVNTHHAYLRKELPRLARVLDQVASAYGHRDTRLFHASATFSAMAQELWSHMMKEEMCLFPMIRQLEASDRPPAFHVGSIADPIRQMELEHDGADSALERLRELTDGFSPPRWACDTYREMLDALSDLERDMHLHIHKENNVLFPRALEMESQERVSPSEAVGAGSC